MRRRDGRDAQVRRTVNDLGRGGAAVVVLVGFEEGWIGRVGDDRHETAPDSRGKIEALLHRIALERGEPRRALERAERPHIRTRRMDIGDVGHIDGIEPVTGGVTFAMVFYGPLNVERRIDRSRGIRLNVDHLQIGHQHNRPDHIDRARLVVVVVQLVGIVGIEPIGEGVLEDRVIRIRPRRDVVGAAGDIVRQRDVDDLLVGFAGGERAFVAESAKQDATVATGVRARFVARQPHSVGPFSRAGGIGSVVGHREANLHGAAVNRLRGRHHTTRDQI